MHIGRKIIKTLIFVLNDARLSYILQTTTTTTKTTNKQENQISLVMQTKAHIAG